MEAESSSGKASTTGGHARTRGKPQGQVRFKCALKNTIYDILRARPGWVEVTEGDWDFYWCEVSWLRDNFDHSYFEEHVRICHFRNHYELTRKNLMVRNLKRYRKQIEKQHGKDEAAKCDFFPTTYELPAEYHLFVEEFRKHPGSTWIMKPTNKSQGKGIFLVRKLNQITEWKKEYPVRRDDPGAERELPEVYIVSRYIENPYLIGGKKFDIRVYVLVTSYIPLKAWLNRSGFARFSNTRFVLDDINDSYIHLTNVAVQKTAPDYDPEKGCKWGLQQLRSYFVARHGKKEANELYRAMDDLIIRSLHSVQRVIINDKHCFELYGFDIMIDSNLKPWIIEVNASPSLTASSPLDYQLKCGVLTDMLDIIDMEGRHYVISFLKLYVQHEKKSNNVAFFSHKESKSRLTGKETRIGSFDLIWSDGPVHSDQVHYYDTSPPYPTNSFMGCYDDREAYRTQMLRSLAEGKSTH